MSRLEDAGQETAESGVAGWHARLGVDDLHRVHHGKLLRSTQGEDGGQARNQARTREQERAPLARARSQLLQTLVVNLLAREVDVGGTALDGGARHALPALQVRPHAVDEQPGLGASGSCGRRIQDVQHLRRDAARVEIRGQRRQALGLAARGDHTGVGLLDQQTNQLSTDQPVGPRYENRAFTRHAGLLADSNPKGASGYELYDDQFLSFSQHQYLKHFTNDN